MLGTNIQSLLPPQDVTIFGCTNLFSMEPSDCSCFLFLFPAVLCDLDGMCTVQLDELFCRTGLYELRKDEIFFEISAITFAFCQLTQ